jgi:hypothetical protein
MYLKMMIACLGAADSTLFLAAVKQLFNHPFLANTQTCFVPGR